MREANGSLMVSAIWIAPFAREWLQQSTAVRLLHVFDRACNLVNRKGEVVSLVAADVGPGPFAVVVSLERTYSFARRITMDTPVTVADHAITLGSLTVDTTRAALWPPRPAWETLRAQRTARPAYLPRLETRLSTHLVAHDVDVGADGRHWLCEAAAPLLQALVAQDLGACRVNVRRLAGLGGGLTPAGDDFIMGALYGLWGTQPPARARRWAQTMVDTAVPRTTTLSAAWLRAAAGGEAGAAWHALVDGMIDGDAPRVDAALDRILATGHTSGADALAGFTAVWRTVPG